MWVRDLVALIIGIAIGYCIFRYDDVIAFLTGKPKPYATIHGPTVLHTPSGTRYIWDLEREEWMNPETGKTYLEEGGI